MVVTGLMPTLLISAPVVPMVTPTPDGAPLKAVAHLSTQMLTETQVTQAAATLVPLPAAPEMASGATANMSLVPQTPVWNANCSVSPTTPLSRTLASTSPTTMIFPLRLPAMMSLSP